MADYDSSLPIRTETNGDVKNTLAGGVTPANLAEVNSSNELLVKDTDLETVLTDGSQKVVITDGTDDVAVNADGSLNVVFPTGAQIEITDGTDTLAINSDGSINVVVADEVAGNEYHGYGTVSAGVPGTPNTVVDYLVTAGFTLQIKAIQAACSGKAKFELLTGTDGSETTKAVGFISTASGFGEIVFPQPIEVAAGDSVLLIITNNDKANADVYGFVNGNEIAN